MLTLAGVTARDTSVAGVTVRVVEPEMFPDVAVIVVEPEAAEVARPLEPAALLIAATPVLEELQVTAAVRSCVVLSENIPVAVSCCTVPLAMLGLVGVTVIATSSAGVTVRMVEPDMVSAVAEIVALPTRLQVTFMRPGVFTAAAVTRPLIDATLVSDELHVNDAVRSFVVPFE